MKKGDLGFGIIIAGRIAATIGMIIVVTVLVAEWTWSA